MRKYPEVKVTVDEAHRNTYATRISTGEIGDVFWVDENDANNYKKNHNALLMLDYYMDKPVSYTHLRGDSAPFPDTERCGRISPGGKIRRVRHRNFLR